MNNEPVAWMYQDDESRSVTFYRDTLPCGAIPLYTHPVKQPMMVLDGNRVYSVFKELTDEEMLEICQRIGVDYGSWYIHEFAKAILRKASEK